MNTEIFKGAKVKLLNQHPQGPGFYEVRVTYPGKRGVKKVVFVNGVDLVQCTKLPGTNRYCPHLI